MSLSKAHFRSLLLKSITEKNISTFTVNKIMCLFGNMTVEEKEKTAKELIPQVQNCKTGEQILSTVKAAIQKAKGERHK